MEDQNSRSSIIGVILVMLLVYLWMQFNKPPLPATPTDQTTIAQTNTTTTTPDPNVPPPGPAVVPPATDSQSMNMLSAKFGAFTPSGTGQEQFVTLQNDLLRIKFSSKGGRIREIFFKKFSKINTDTSGRDVKSDLYLLEDAKNRFDYDLAVQNTASGKVNTADLFFTPTVSGNTVTFRASAGEGRYFEQNYTLSPDNYQIDYNIVATNLQSVLSKTELYLNWDNYLDKIEKNQDYERTMSSVYFKPVNENSDYCNCTKNATESLGPKPVQWFAHSNQFFNTAIIAKNFAFREFTGQTQVYTSADPDLKLLKTSAILPLDNNGTASMTLFAGPNEYERLRAYNISLEDVIPFGASILGGINRWVIHRIFSFLSMFVSNQGIIILLLTLLVKLMVYPLTYRMVYSQAKMTALKPRLDDLRKKHGDDQQAISAATMKLYSEFGVNPLGSCLPVFLQMPIWFALYRFFPASIEFRQASFLWATDLSSYDVMVHLPFQIWGFGNHISAFTIIWVITTLWYTWYSMKQMDTSAMSNPAMKYMQFLMPVMFMFFFNSFAAGLTLYLCFSNILNIVQTVATKRFFIDNDKIHAELEANRNKPRKAGGIRERLENAMKEQQKVQEAKDPKTKKK